MSLRLSLFAEKQHGLACPTEQLKCIPNLLQSMLNHIRYPNIERRFIGACCNIRTNQNILIIKCDFSPKTILNKYCK